jgi:hypothetical protein
MFNKLILAAAVAIPLGVLGLSGSAMAGYSPTLHTPLARPHSRMLACSDYDYGSGSSCDARQMRQLRAIEHHRSWALYARRDRG